MTLSGRIVSSSSSLVLFAVLTRDHDPLNDFHLSDFLYFALFRFLVMVTQII